MNKDTCILIGKLLKEADRLHLEYYKSRRLLSVNSTPHELNGGKILMEFLNNPYKGLDSIIKRSAPFLKFCKFNVKRKDITDEERNAYGLRIKMFGEALSKVSEEPLFKDRVDKKNNVNYVDDVSQNQIMIEYFI